MKRHPPIRWCYSIKRDLILLDTIPLIIASLYCILMLSVSCTASLRRRRPPAVPEFHRVRRCCHHRSRRICPHCPLQELLQPHPSPDPLRPLPGSLPAFRSAAYHFHLQRAVRSFRISSRLRAHPPCSSQAVPHPHLGYVCPSSH